MRLSILFARFPYGRREDPDVTDWLLRTHKTIMARESKWDVYHARFDDTPITMTRNAAVEHAKNLGVDLLCMVDSDMAPDCHLGDPAARPFWDSSVDFLLKHEGPCVVAAPYCGPPPHSNVYVFRWANGLNAASGPDMRLEQFTRYETGSLAGIQPAAALATGLILIDMRAVARLKPPYFYYEWADATESKKASTEDVTFTRDLSLSGVPLYVNWDAWAGHWKPMRMDRPQNITADAVAAKLREALLRNEDSRDRLIDVRPGPLARRARPARPVGENSPTDSPPDVPNPFFGMDKMVKEAAAARGLPVGDPLDALIDGHPLTS